MSFVSVGRTSIAVAAIALGWAPPATATPTKRCIEAAESGQQLRGSGKLTEARKAFGVCTASTCPAAVRRDCARWIEEVDAAIPTIAVRLEDESGREITDGKVMLDGDSPIVPSAGRAVPVDPGAHRFVWTRPEGNVEEEVVIREGEHNRTIILRVRTTSSGPRDPARAKTEKPQPAPVETSRSPWPWVIGGVGVAALGAGSAFWIVGLGERSDLERTCASAHACVQNDIDSSRTKLVVGDVLVGVGVVALAGALLLYLFQDGDARAQPSSASALR